eukprot:s1018_g1.t3
MHHRRCNKGRQQRLMPSKNSHVELVGCSKVAKMQPVKGTSNDCHCVGRFQKKSMAEIDVSVFSKMAELLARPLSPTALEKEEAAKNGKRIPKAKVPSRKAAARPKAESKAAASVQAPSPAEMTRDEQLEEQFSGLEDKGILSAVSELSGLQQEWKEKMKHPSFRKGGPPRMKRPPAPAVLDEEERRQKMEEIDTLEVQLKEAKTVAAAAKRAAQAAEQLAEAAAKEAESGSEDGQISQSTEPKKDLPEGDLQQQAEARVKARKRQEAKEKRDRQRKEVEEKRLRQAEAEAKAKELERQTKERLQERLRSERARERQLQEEMEREAEIKEQRSRQVAEELQQQALKRLADKEQAEKHTADELARAEAEAKRQQAQENQARAEELRQKTRRRMQQYTRQQRDQSIAEQEARRKRIEEEAQVADERIMQAIRSQERAKARAAEFRHRERSEEKARAILQEEQHVRQQELAEVAQLERQRKRQWRAELARGPATPLRSDMSSRASSHPPLARPAPRQSVDHFGGVGGRYLAGPEELDAPQAGPYFGFGAAGGHQACDGAKENATANAIVADNSWVAGSLRQSVCSQHAVIAFPFDNWQGFPTSCSEASGRPFPDLGGHYTVVVEQVFTTELVIEQVVRLRRQAWCGSWIGHLRQGGAPAASLDLPVVAAMDTVARVRPTGAGPFDEQVPVRAFLRAVRPVIRPAAVPCGGLRPRRRLPVRAPVPEPVRPPSGRGVGNDGLAP